MKNGLILSGKDSFCLLNLDDRESYLIDGDITAELVEVPKEAFFKSMTKVFEESGTLSLHGYYRERRKTSTGEEYSTVEVETWKSFDVIEGAIIEKKLLPSDDINFYYYVKA